MSDWIMFPVFIIFGIIGYLLMGLIDKSIDRHAAGTEKTEQEKRTDEHAKARKPKHAYPGVPFFLHVQR